MADINIAGQKVPQWALWGAGGVVVVGGVLWYKNKQNSSSSTSGTNSSATDPLTGLPYSEDSSIDPLTGMTYLQEAQQYGSVSAAEQAVSANNSSGYSGSGSAGGSGYSGYGYGYPTSNQGPSSSSTTSFTTNAQWGQSAIAALEQSGYSSTDSTTAISTYLAGLSLTTTQAQLVQTAINEIGEPPNPLPITTTPAGSNSGGSGTSSSGGPITVAPTGLHVVKVNGLAITVGWNPVQVPQGQGPLVGYTVAYGQDPNNTPYELSVGPETTQATITFNSGPGAHGLTHYFVVWARPASPGGPHAGPVSAKTQ